MLLYALLSYLTHYTKNKTFILLSKRKWHEYLIVKKVVQLDSCGGFLIILWVIFRSTGRRPYK